MLRITAHRFHPLVPGAALMLLAVLRPWLERSMVAHMAIELPALFVIGWLASRSLHPDSEREFSQWNAAGVPSLLAAALVLGFWMLPVALDAAVLDWRIAIGKAVTMVGAGFAVGWCWLRVGPVIQAFFLFNWCSMNLTVGILYQSAPQQLCSVYLPFQQEMAGKALATWAIAILAAWLILAAKKLMRA